MAFNLTQRPQFYEEQYLGAADLSAAVDYARIQQARHALGAHTWGIALGLQLKETPQPGGSVTVHLLPGYAWDGYGRPIVVLAPYQIPEELFSAIQYDPIIDGGGKGRLIALWLRYYETAAQPPRPGFEVCDGADQHARIQETFLIEIGDRPNTTDRYSGVTIAARSLADAKTSLRAFDPAAPLVYDESIPHQAIPDPQERARWLIPIGYVRWLPVLNQPGHFVARDDSGAVKDSDKIRRVRRYIGVVAEEIEAADSVIRLRDRGKDPAGSFFQAPTLDQIANSTNDLVWVEGNLRVVGNAKLCGGNLDFRDAQGSDAIPKLEIRRDDSTPNVSVLQMVIGSDPPKNHRFAVGPLTAGKVDEKFVVSSGGHVGIGTTTPDSHLTIQGSAGTYLNIKADGGAHEVLLGADGAGGIVSTMTNHDLQLRAGANATKVIIKANGNVGIGTDTPVSNLEVNGDIALEKRDSGTPRALPADATMLWNDGTWLRLNQNLDFTKPIFGVHTPGVFAPVSLNVGGAGGWGDPGWGNVWVTGRVGIGTTTPQTSLHVTGGAIMPAVGNSQAAGIQFPSDPGGGAFDEAFIRYFVISGETTKLLIGCQNDLDDTIGFYQFNAERMTIYNGNVGIGTTTPRDNLDVVGDLRISRVARKPGGGPWTNSSSDASLKKKVAPLAGALDRLLQLRGVRFEWKEPEKMGDLTGTQMGLIAQEVEKVFPEWVSVGPDGYKEITIRGFEALTIEAFRELKAEIEELKARLDKSPKQKPAGGRPQKKKSPKEEAS